MVFAGIGWNYHEARECGAGDIWAEGQFLDWTCHLPWTHYHNITSHWVSRSMPAYRHTCWSDLHKLKIGWCWNGCKVRKKGSYIYSSPEQHYEAQVLSNQQKTSDVHSSLCYRSWAANLRTLVSPSVVYRSSAVDANL